MADTFDPMTARLEDAPSTAKKDEFDPSTATLEKPRTWGEAAKDTGAAVMGGLAGLVKTGGDLYGLASGNMDNAASELGRNAQEYWSDAKSQALQTKIAQRKANIDAQESTLGKAWTAVKDTLTDPALAADTVAENVATMLPGAGVGRAVGAAKYARGFQAASEFGPASLAAREAIAKQAGKYATGAAIGTGAVQQGADVSGDIYGDLMKKTDAEWDASPDFQSALQRHGGDRQAAKSELANATARAAFLPAAGISVAANAIPGATYLERALVGAPLRTGAKEVGRFGAARGFAQGVLGEGGQEFVEEGGGRLGANLAAQQQAMPGHDTWDGVGENAGMGFAGGALLGVGGGVHGAREAMAQKRAQDAAKGAEDGGTLETPAADTPPADVPPGDGQSGPVGGLGAPTGTVADMAGMLAPANPLLEAMNQRAADPSAIAPPIDEGKIFDKSAAAPVAGELYQPGDTTNPLTGERITAKPSEAMGINPADGPLSTGAAIAVDTGASGQMQQAAALAEAAKAAPKTPAGKEKTAAPDLSGWSDQQLSDTFRAAQAPAVRRQLVAELQRRRDAREQQALQDELRAEQDGAAPGAENADQAFARTTEDAGGAPSDLAPIPSTPKGRNEPQADQAQQAGAQPAQAPQQRTSAQKPGTVAANPKAIERVNAGKAFFFSEPKAKDFIARNGLADTHEVAQENRAFHVRARRAAETRAFGPETGTLGIARADMPQVPAQSHGGLVKHLNAQGIAHETTMVDAAALKPTQAEYSPAKVEQAKAAGGDRAVIVSSDGHIIDGHHQAVAAAEEGKPVKAIVLDAPVEQALQAVKASPSAAPAGQPVADIRSGKPDPSNSGPMAELGGFKPGDAVDVDGRTIGRSTVEALFRQAAPGLGMADMARVVGADGKKLDVLVGELRSTQPAAQAAENAPPANATPAPKKPRGVLAKKAEADARARADYFTPGNIVQGYGGHDRVIAYNPNDPRSGWSVTVRAVHQVDGRWEDVPNERERMHWTQPGAAQLKAGPVARATATNAAPRPSPGEPGYTLLDARNDLIDLRTQVANEGPVGDDRMHERMRRQEKLVRDMDADSKPAAGTDPAPQSQTVKIPAAIDEALTADMHKQQARVKRLRTQAESTELDLDGKKAAQLKVTAAETTLRKMRTSRFDAEDAVVASEKVGNPGPFAEFADFFPSANEALVQHLLASPAAPVDVQQTLRGAVSTESLSGSDLDAVANILGAGKTESTKPAKAAAKPKAAKKPNAEQTRAKADLMNALADLGDILGKNTRMNIAPEQEQKLLPALTRVLDAAFRLGYHKFKDAAKFALDQIREHIGAEAAAALTLDHLQGAYIATGPGQGKDSKRAVIDVETKAEIEAHEAKTANEAQEDAAAAPGAKTLTESLYQAIGAGNMPKDNPALKKLVEAFDGKPADPARMKQAQEELETAIAMSARDIVAKGQNDKATFDELLRLYESQPSLNIRTSTSVANQAYSTPAPLAFIASRLAGITRNTVAHEPTGGTGMLLIGADPKKALVNELNDLRISALKAQGFAPTQLDAATMRLVPDGVQPDAVVTNPPFGSIKDADGKPVKVKVDGYNIGQIDHLIAARALQSMKDDGKATLILGANKVAGGLSTDDRIFFNWLYSHYNVVGHFEVEGDLYNRQGAGWPVRVITINGRQKSGKFAPVAGTIQRADNWSQVYEQFTQSLDAAAKPATGEVGGGPAVAIEAPGAPGGRRPQGSTGSAGNVAGTSPRAVPDRAKPAAEPVAPVPDEQRLNAQSFVPQPQPGQNPAGAERPAKPAGNAALASPAEAAGNDFQAPYVPRSARKDEGVLIPSNMAQPTQDALNRLEDAVGDIDEFARKELGYDSTEALHNALMGLQVDSVAMAIHQTKQGKAVVIADQTGIGKGRQAASIIRWAARNGMTPVFVSVKPSLFTDMYGDLADIGTHDVEPFILNSDAWVSGQDGEKLFANKASGHRAAIEAIANNGALPAGRNALFMTYSQINTDNAQRRALRALAGNAVFVLDESHNAAGASGTGDFMISVLKEAKGVTYLSATYAKRPDNMPLYFKTDIGDAAADSEGLANAMSAGGLPLQTVVSNNLVKAGQMFRRERSYDGVSIASTFDSKNRALHEEMSDTATQALRAIVRADRLFHEIYVKQLQKQLKAEGGDLKDIAGNQASAGVQHTEFSSVVHNFVRQMLLGLKAQTAADEAIASLKRGEKPIIAVENTMGSFLSEYAGSNGLTQGDSLGSFDYRTVLSRALERSRALVETLPTGEEVRKTISLAQLDPITRKAYDQAQDVIDGLKIAIPVSPIDWMRAEIERAGFSVAEITGRNLAVDYSNKGKPVLSAIEQAEQRDKVATTRRFNGGELDALILNVAGSTGISLHASEKFQDQRQRHMIVAQAAGDINIFMQMLGRIHRTGQVRLPKYTVLSVDLPTEKRPTAVLSKKMKSLNANTSSNTESATSVKTADILNKYGDQIVHQYLQDNMELARQLDVDDIVGGDTPAEDIARKATGRLALQPIEVQNGFYEDVEAQYDALIDYLNKTNQNDLEPRTFDFDAKETRSEVLFDGPNKETPFGADAVYGEYSIKAQGSPMTPDEIKAAIESNLGGKTGAEHADALANQMLQTYAEQFNQAREKAGTTPDTFAIDKYTALMKSAFGDAGVNMAEEAQALIANGMPLPSMTARDMMGAQGVGTGMDFIKSHAIGRTFRVDINSEPFNAVVTNVRNTHKATGNPFSMSKLQLTVSVNGALRSITVPATQFKKIEVSSIAPTFRVEVLFKEQPPNQRETAKIITGNLLAAYGELKGVNGTIISFTTADGGTEQGILLPKLFDYAKNTQGDYRLRSGAEAVNFLQRSENKDIGRFGIATRDGQVRVLPYGDGVQVRVPRSRAQGARYFLDKNLIAIAGDFVSTANAMTAKVENAADAAKLLDLLMDKQALYALPSMAEEAKALAPKDAPAEDAANFEGNAKRRPGTAQDKAVMQALADGKSARDVLRLIANTSKSRFYRQVARLLLKSGITPDVVLADTDLGGGDGFKFKAKYSRAQDRVTLTGEAAGQAEQIMLHELIHAATLKALDKPGLHSLQMRRLFEHVKRQGGAAGQYGMKNVGEFVAEAFTNPEFQRLLRQMDAPAGGSLKSAWEGFVRILRSILGLPQDGHDALSRALEVGVAVMREDMGLRQRGERGVGGDAHFGAADLGDRMGAAIKSVTATGIKQRAGFKATDYLGLGLQALGRRQIVDIYGDMLPLAEYNKLVQQMEADKSEGGAEADQLVTRWAKLSDEGKLADLMHDATLAQIDPAKPYVDGDDKARYMTLQGRFNALSAEAKQVYTDTRDSYQAHHAKVRSAIKERIERSEIKGERKAALLKQMDDEFFKAIKGVYFPLARFGQYAVTVKGPDGKVESVSRAETKAEAEELRNNLLAAFPRDKGFTVGRVMLSKDFIADRDAVGRGFMTDLYQVLDKQDMDAAQRAELEDMLGQLYLSSLPDLSWAKHGIHRKGTPGFSQDARRAFAQNMFHGARYLAKLRYSDLMQDQLAAMQKHVDDWREVEDFDQNSAQRVVDEMNKRHESLMNPKSNPLSTALTSLGFVFHLGLSPASAMVNLSQTALVAYPIMGAKWGFSKASAALLKASKQAAAGKNDITGSLNADERAAYDEAVRAGTIDVTMAHDLAGIAQGEDAGVMWKIRPVMRWASFLFHQAERFNRQVTFVAAYRLARDAGADHKAAFEQATKATYDGHFDYGAANRPRIMQGNVAKVLLLFKQYGQNMVYTLSRNAYQSIKGTDAEKAEARKALAGLLTSHAMAAGVLGLPMVTTLLAAASMIGGDDDEPWDAKVALQNMLADAFGQKPAEVLAHGLSRLTPWDISGRVGLDRLIFPDVQEGLEGQRLAESAMAAALGPVAGIGVNVLKGAQHMSEGRYAMGLEAMLPSALRGPVKALRYAEEGVQDKSGISILDQVSPAAVAGQALGFSPSAARNAQEGKSAILAHDRALGERRQELLTKIARATMAKDEEAKAEAREEIRRFNEKNPGRRINPNHIMASVRGRQKRIDQAQDGVYLPRNRRDAMEVGRFALAD